MAVDFKKTLKHLYAPETKPSIVDVEKANYIAVRGSGDPNDENSEYKQSISLLFPVAYAIKMSKKGDYKIPDYFDFVVPPLEGFWWQEGIEGVDYANKQNFKFVSLIRMPDFVTKEVYSSLKEGGKFVFDIHTPKKVSDMLEKQVFGYEDEEISYLWFTYETENELEVESELSFFIKENNGLYKKLEQFHSQRTYEIESVLAEIQNIGFKVKDYFCDFDENNKNYTESDRIIFILEK